MSTRAERYDAVVTAASSLAAPAAADAVGARASSPPGSPTSGSDWSCRGSSRCATTRCGRRRRQLDLDVVVHAEGLVTDWASGDCVGDPGRHRAQGSFEPPADAAWLLLVGDLTAMPAMARIAGTTGLPTRIWAEVPDDLTGYLPAAADVTWLDAAGRGAVAARRGRRGHRLARGRRLLLDGRRVGADAGDPQAPDARAAAAQHGVRRDGLLARGRAPRQPRAVDPGPIWRAGKAAGQVRRGDLGRRTTRRAVAESDTTTEQGYRSGFASLRRAGPTPASRR